MSLFYHNLRNWNSISNKASVSDVKIELNDSKTEIIDNPIMKNIVDSTNDIKYVI